MKPLLLIRADATPRMGTGHVMRCLALAQVARREGLDVHMVCRLGVDWLRERLAREDIPLHCLPDMPPAAEPPDALLQQLQTDNLAIPGTTSTPIWVVLDGYHFDTVCQLAVMRAGYRLLVIDDYAHLPEYHCDALLNQNIGAELLSYQGNIGRKLLGLEYVLLRQEFWDVQEKAQQRSRPAQPQNILITLGGGNFIEHLEKIAADMCLPELAGRTIRVIQGAMEADRIRAAFTHCPAQLEILPRVDDMPALLLDTDLCVTAGGSTCWELCCLGVPFLTVEVAANQHNIVKYLEKYFSIPQFSLEAVKSQLASISSLHSPKIHKENIYKLLNDQHEYISFIPATENDIQFVFSLANDKDVRKMSFQQHTITWHEHTKWFHNMLIKKNPFLIALYKNKKCGYIRFNNTCNESEITIAIDKAYRGKHLAKHILREACLKIVHESPIKHIQASIKSENVPSLSTFEKAYFTYLSDNKTHNNSVKKYIFPAQGNYVPQ